MICSKQITTLPEYYPTRAEREILTAYGADIARRLRGAETLVELGSGTSDKTATLIDALLEAGTLRRFVAFDVAEPTLRNAWPTSTRPTRSSRSRGSSGTSESTSTDSRTTPTGWSPSSAAPSAT